MLTTIEKVKRYLVMPVSDDKLIEDLIKQVGKNVENFCNRFFLYGTYTEKFDGEGDNEIFLKGFPVREVVYVKVDGEEISDYEVDYQLGIIHRENGFPSGFRNVEVKYTCGYDATSEDDSLHPPEDFDGAICEEIVSRYENLTTETRTGENLVDLRTNFLTSRARDYFSRLRMPNV